MSVRRPPDSITSFTRGDLGRARALTTSLQTLRDREKDPGIREALDDVLRGRSTFREFLRTPAGSTILGRGSAAIQRTWPMLSEEEKSQLADQGRSSLAELRDEDKPPPAT